MWETERQSREEKKMRDSESPFGWWLELKIWKGRKGKEQRWDRKYFNSLSKKKNGEIEILFV